MIDKDPSAMAAALQVIDDLPSAHLYASSDLFNPLIFIIDQFLNGNAPHSEYYIFIGYC